MEQGKVAIWGAVLFAALFVWLFRYEMEPRGSGIGVYMLDRWTGRAYVCDSSCARIYPTYERY